MAKSTPKKKLTKKDQLIRMLRTKSGADVATLSARLGWQPHTTRAAMTGLRKSGHEIIATKPDGGGFATYRIVGTARKEAAAEAATHAG